MIDILTRIGDGRNALNNSVNLKLCDVLFCHVINTEWLSFLASKYGIIFLKDLIRLFASLVSSLTAFYCDTRLYCALTMPLKEEKTVRTTGGQVDGKPAPSANTNEYKQPLFVL